MAAASPARRLHIIIEISGMQTLSWLHTVCKSDPFCKELGLCNCSYGRICVVKASLEGVCSCVSPGLDECVTVQDGQGGKAVAFRNVWLKYPFIF